MASRRSHFRKDLTLRNEHQAMRTSDGRAFAQEQQIQWPCGRGGISMCKQQQ